jgi:hypothetical protein
MKKGGLYSIELPIKDKIYWTSPTKRFFNILIDEFMISIIIKKVEIWIPPPYTKPNNIKMQSIGRQRLQINPRH